jgi:CHAD domain-containing protein
MSYRLEARESLPTNIKRIATEQVDQALEQLRHPPDDDRDEAIHDARKCFKKIRAVLRLVRDEIGEQSYKQENTCYRDAGRRLSDIRDSAVMVETLDEIIQHFDDQLAPEAFVSFRDRLVEEHQSFKQDILDHQGAMSQVAAIIDATRSRIANWPVRDDDFSALYGGLKRVYKRGHNRMAEAYAESSPERYHEWRKRAKYLWYHTRILTPLWPELLAELADQLHDMGDYLGHDHDLSELRRTIMDRPKLMDDKTETQALIGLIDQRRTELEAAARPIAERIYVEKPKAFVDRIGGYWQVWRETQENTSLQKSVS